MKEVTNIILLWMSNKVHILEPNIVKNVNLWPETVCIARQFSIKMPFRTTSELKSVFWHGMFICFVQCFSFYACCR